jgi:hypothetical protein
LLLLALLGAAEIGLLAAGTGPLATPPHDRAGLAAWVSTGDPLLHAAALARMLALVLGGLHVVALVLALTLRSAGLHGLANRCARCSPALVRRAVERTGVAALAGTLAIGGSTSIAAAATTAPSPPTTTAPTDVPHPAAVMQWEAVDATPLGSTPTTGDRAGAAGETGDAPSDASSTTSSTASSTTESPPMGVSGPPPTSVHATLPSAPPAQPVPMRPAPLPPAAELGTLTSPADKVQADPDRGTWTVQRGQHLWGIAVEVARERGDSSPDARAVADYWVELIEANRSRLVDPSNPDLIHPGLVLTLP